MQNAKTFNPEDIRNIAIIGHSHVGKTAIAEAILFDEGLTTRLGSVDDETSNFDYEPEEIKRHSSVQSHFGWVNHQGKKINLIDTPGDQNFFLDGVTSLLGTDAVVGVVSAPDGVQLQTRRAWAKARELHLPRAIFLNKMDRTSKPWDELVKQVCEDLHVEGVPIQIPIGKGEEFVGVVDLVAQKAYKWKPDASGKFVAEDIPEELKSYVEKATMTMKEAVVSTNDELLEKYLEGEAIADDVFKKTFVEAVRNRKFIPILFGSATMNIGIQPLLDFMAEVYPDPIHRGPVACIDKDGGEIECAHNPSDPFLAQVIHTSVDDQYGQLSVIRIFSGKLPSDGHVKNVSTGEEIRLGSAYVLQGHDREKIDEVVCGDIISAVKLKNTHTNDSICAVKDSPRFLPRMEYPKPMMSYLMIPNSKKDEDKLKEALDKLHEEDPTLSVSVDGISHHMVLHGMGHGHLENAMERINRKYGLSISHEFPPIAYRETFMRAVNNIEGKHKKQSGGAGQFGVAVINVEPLPRDQGFEFVNKIHGGAIPKQYIPSVEKGVSDKAKHGIAAGYPVVDFRVTLIDGKYHPVDSKDIAYQMAGVKGLKIAMEKSGSRILEPIHKIEVAVPSEYSGDVMGDISTRRGQVLGMDSQDAMTFVHARCPLSEMRSYVAELHSMTQGKGSFTSEFDGYEFLPDHLIEKVKSDSPFVKETASSDD